MKTKKLFICFMLAFVLLTTSVFATDTTVVQTSPATINDDLYIYDVDSYTLSDNVNGNLFVSTNKFTVNPRSNGGVISGDLFLISSNVSIQSDVTYSNDKDKNGNYIIDSINSTSKINGNAYILSDSFTLETGSEIHGDLYIASTTVNIEQGTVIDGNVFITASEVNLNGQVTGSAYITADNFTLNYSSYITRDLFLSAQKANLSGVIYRNAFVTVNEDLITSSDFRINQNLSVDYANSFTFSGEIKGNAIINAKNLKFKNDNSEKCFINGSLKYATQNDINVPEGIVTGEVNKTDFVEQKSNDSSAKNTMFGFFTLLLYVLAIVFFSKKIAPNALDKLPAITVKNSIISLCAGFLSFFAIFILFVLLCVLGAGIYLALALLVAYLFLLALALPLFLYNIANVIKLKLSLYVKLLLVTAVFYLISLIPTLGGSFVFIIFVISIGRILYNILRKKN